ncbi:hypothetical protein P3S67_022802 [Capsicum chacoense]|uniref:uncharacterized protein LOC107858624 n=1 Tax=Capsicum annuum TaxID=4072 RepID=UPI001FB0B81F|nr:uncharacterized protein LOC107858624 [Capsicum annuum]KAF3628143.1 putative malate dehydrogenase, glyoxysomal-like isoform X1 [Capsicum annuum]KAF3654888.1 putative malate dehydrogenase, glyoxysomal-like isoform X1 [Capsicum annuum]
MATTVAENLSTITTICNPKPARVCFSYAAYAKNIIQHLKSSNIIVEKGLCDDEFCTIESKFSFIFPPDLRSILQEGLPIGHGFPNWRSSSEQQLEIIKNLPILSLCKQVKKRKFWAEFWGIRPIDNDHAVDIANEFLKKAPVLVPIYQHYYIPCTPCLAGNPVFYVHEGEVKLWSFDISGFFQQLEFQRKEMILRRSSLFSLLNAPAWAATEARKIEFWTEMVAAVTEPGGGRHRRWWSEDLEGYLEDVFLRLTEAGWKDEDVREMMMVDDGWDDGGDGERRRCSDGGVIVEKKEVETHVRLLSKRLLRAGWSREDVVDSLGSSSDEIYPEEDFCFDFFHKTS